MPYKCMNCGVKFIEPSIIHTSYESHYGVIGLFSCRTPLELEVCPSCNDEDLEELYEDDEREE